MKSPADPAIGDRVQIKSSGYVGVIVDVLAPYDRTSAYDREHVDPRWTHWQWCIRYDVDAEENRYGLIGGTSEWFGPSPYSAWFSVIQTRAKRGPLVTRWEQE